MNIIKYKKIYLIIALSMIIVGLSAIFAFKPTAGIDFTGGTLVEVRGLEQNISEIRTKLSDIYKEEDILIQESGEKQYILRAKIQTEEDYKSFEQKLKDALPGVDILRHESIGSTVGRDLTRKAIIAIVVAAVLIIGYLAYAFKSASRKISSWSFGTIAVVALIHDLIFSFAIYSVASKFAGYEIEGMTVVAALTILGFSVHDTIVVYDRIRENMIKNPQKSVAENANNSVNQTLARSLNTSLTLLLVLVAMLILGGATVKPFVFMLTIGIAIGTYSSIFVAAPVLVWWYELRNKEK